MSNENWLIYPTVDLFVYDLAEGIGENENKISQNSQQFWQKIYGDKLSASQLEKLKQAEAETADYIELLGKQQIEPFEFPLDGYAYPVKIGDTYAVQFDLSGKIEPDADKKFEPKEIDCLGRLKEQVISRVNPPATIGQSWLVWGQLTANDQNVLETAKNCYKQLNLFPNAKWETDLQTAGKFLGADFYELWCPPGDRGKIEQNYHVLICLFPYSSDRQIGDISQKVTKLYSHFRRLFLFRNKVISSYTQSRQTKAKLKEASRMNQEIFTQLPQQVTAANSDLKQLQETLVKCLIICSKYAEYLSNLEEQETIIKTNLENYKRNLEKIGQEIESNAETFKFMESFSDFAQKKYVWQVEADNRSLSPNLRLLENAIETIEGIIEIERAKSDRALNVTIGAVGAGIATSGVVASTYASQIKSPASRENPMDVNAVFGLSMGLGIVAGVLGAIVLILIGKKRR